MINFLSHPLSNKTVAYGGATDFKFEYQKKMDCGDSCNQMRWEFSNHLGTHIDCPFHFSTNGKKITDYEASFWDFKKVYLLKLKLDGTHVEVGPWCEDIPKDCELLLIKTGHETYRESDPKKYWEKGPGLSPELGAWLRKNRNLRAIGLDFISVTSYQDRPLGRVADKAFLDPSFEGTPILAIEDMKLAGLETSPSKVVVSPILVENADGSPVTVFSYE